MTAADADGVYRTSHEALPATARLCIAIDLTGRSQSIRSRKVTDWRREPPSLPKKLPAVFLFLC